MENSPPTRQVSFGGVTVTVPATWEDITDELEEDDPPFTLADSGSDSGAMQFTVGMVRSGKQPQVTCAALRSMLLDFGNSQGFGAPADLLTAEFPLRIAQGLFRDEGDAIRVWYLSDGDHVAFVTFVGPWNDRAKPLETCDRIVRSVRFGQP